MIPRLSLTLGLAASLAACQSVGPVHIGEINQARATVLAQAELGRHHLDPYATWRSEVSDYGMLWEVTFYRPAGKAEGPPLVRVAVDKKNERVVLVSVGD